LDFPFNFELRKTRVIATPRTKAECRGVAGIAKQDGLNGVVGIYHGHHWSRMIHWADEGRGFFEHRRNIRFKIISARLGSRW
jgi:hypothetical protein